MELVEGTKRRRLSYEGYFYSQDSTNGDTIYMKCSQKVSKNCRGRAMLENGRVTLTRDHSHAPNAAVIERAKTRAEMKRRAVDTGEAVSVICAEAEAGMSRASRAEMPRATDTARNVRRHRQNANGLPAQPQSAEEVVLSDMDKKTIARPGSPAENFLIYDSKDDAGPRILIFGSEWGIWNLVHSAHWGADGTFDVAPRIFTQLYTIHGSVHGQTVPCIYALLPNKTRHTYTRMLQVLREEVERRYPQANLTGTIITDLEMAALQAFETVFPEKQRSLCFFHFSQAVWRKTQELGLARLYATDAEFALMVSFHKLNFISMSVRIYLVLPVRNDLRKDNTAAISFGMELFEFAY